MKNSKSIKKIAMCAMLIALSSVIGILCKNLFTMGLYYRITFENLPIIFASVTLGPIYGVIVGFASDILSCLCSTNPAVNPFITLGAMCVGLVSGLIAKRINKGLLKKISFSAIGGHLVGQVLIKQIAKMYYFGMPWWGFFIGLAVSVFVCVFEIIIINILLKNKTVKNYMEKLK